MKSPKRLLLFRATSCFIWANYRSVWGNGVWVAHSSRSSSSDFILVVFEKFKQTLHSCTFGCLLIFFVLFDFPDSETAASRTVWEPRRKTWAPRWINSTGRKIELRKLELTVLTRPSIRLSSNKTRIYHSECWNSQQTGRFIPCRSSSLRLRSASKNFPSRKQISEIFFITRKTDRQSIKEHKQTGKQTAGFFWSCWCQSRLTGTVWLQRA